jgi:hypothetical protein
VELSGSWEGPDYVITHEGIQLSFSRIYEARDGEHTAMLRVSVSGVPGYAEGDIYDSKIILTGPRSKADAVKACKERVTEYVDWYALIERSCQMVRRAIEEGEPPINLGTVERPPKLNWLVEPLFRDGEHAMVYGPGGAGKSLLCLATLACLQHGADYLGFPIARQLRCLYLDYEDNWETHAGRLDALTEGLGMGPPPEIIYKEATAPLSAMVQTLSRIVAREKIDVVVIDSAGAACGADPEKADAALAYFRAIKSLGVRSSITIAHHSKQDESMPFGSVFWWNSMRNIWLVKVSHDTENEIHIGLFHKKVNNGALQSPQGLRIAFTDSSIVIDREDLRDVPTMLAEMSAPVRIETAIKQHIRDHQRGPTREWLHEELSDLKAGTFSRDLLRLIKNNRIQFRMGVYELVYQSDGH